MPPNMFSVGERLSILLLSRSNHPSSLGVPPTPLPIYIPEFFWLSWPGRFKSDPDLWWRAREGLLKGMSMTLSDCVESCLPPSFVGMA